MTAPDRGAELISAMLERRAAQASPALRDRIAAGAARTPQDRNIRTLDRLGALLVIGVVVALAATGGYLAGRQGGTTSERAPSAVAGGEPSRAAGVASAALGPSSATGGTTDPSPNMSGATAVPSLAVPPTAPPVLTVGGLAVVTSDGAGLRVRTQPGVVDPATRLQPLLPSGARMLILRGPMTRDNHDWYQVSIDRVPGFGWVAAGGGVVPWLAPEAPLCSGSRAPAEAWTLPAIDLLACYGSQPFTVEVVGMSAGPVTACADVAAARGCVLSPRWLMEPQTVTVLGEDGDTAPLTLAVPDSARAILGASSPNAPVAIMIGLDSPAAQACRVVDGAGLDVVARDDAVVTCRLTFVVLAVAR